MDSVNRATLFELWRELVLAALALDALDLLPVALDLGPVAIDLLLLLVAGVLMALQLVADQSAGA